MLKLINKFLNKIGYILLEVDVLEIPKDNLQLVYIPVNISMSKELKEYIKEYETKSSASDIIHISAIDFALSNENFIINVSALKAECLNLQNSYGNFIILTGSLNND